MRPLVLLELGKRDVSVCHVRHGLPSFTERLGGFLAVLLQAGKLPTSPRTGICGLILQYSVGRQWVDYIPWAAREFNSMEEGSLAVKHPAQLLIHIFSLSHGQFVWDAGASDGNSCSSSSLGTLPSCECSAEQEGTPLTEWWTACPVPPNTDLCIQSLFEALDYF